MNWVDIHELGHWGTSEGVTVIGMKREGLRHTGPPDLHRFVESAVNRIVDKRFDDVSRCGGRLRAYTHSRRPERACSMVTSIGSFVAAA
jgi:hypothetical protein